MADGLKLLLLHHESYLVYEKGHKVGHCHSLCLLLVQLLLPIPSASFKKPLFSQILLAYHQLLHAKKELGYPIELDNLYVYVPLNDLLKRLNWKTLAFVGVIKKDIVKTISWAIYYVSLYMSHPLIRTLTLET